METQKKTYNEKMGITKEMIAYLAVVFDHPSKINEIEEIHAKIKNPPEKKVQKKEEGDI